MPGLRQRIMVLEWAWGLWDEELEDYRLRTFDIVTGKTAVMSAEAWMSMREP